MSRSTRNTGPELLLAGALVAASAGAQAGPWRPLFDGETLTGWSRVGGAATYRVEDGAIVGRTAPNSPNTFLRTDRELGDFELELEFAVDAELNSGVQLRSVVDGHVRGYQYEIDPSGRAWTGGIYEEGDRGWLADLSANEAGRGAFRPGEWNHARIVCFGPLIETWINGMRAARLVDSRRLRGFVALQVHGVGARTDPLEVRWRNLRVRDLGETRFVPLEPARWSPGPGGRVRTTDSGLAVDPGPTPLALVPGRPPTPFVLRARVRSRGGPVAVAAGDARIALDDGDTQRVLEIAGAAGCTVVTVDGVRHAIEGDDLHLVVEVAASAALELDDSELAVTRAAAATASRPTTGSDPRSR